MPTPTAIAASHIVADLFMAGLLSDSIVRTPMKHAPCRLDRTGALRPELLCAEHSSRRYYNRRCTSARRDSGASGAMVGRAAAARKVPRRVDERDVGEGLREIADETAS